MKRYIYYCRTSKEKQIYGLESQKQICETYIKNQGGEVLASFSEHESGARNDRPELLKAIAFAKQNKCSLVFSRLDRASRDQIYLLTLLRDSGVNFVFVDFPQADKFQISILLAFSELERQKISERTKAGLAVAKAKGVQLGNKNYAYALTRARAKIQQIKNEYNSKMLLVIKDIQSTGIKGLQNIANCLDKRGEKTINGKNFTPMAVKRILDSDPVKPRSSQS